jgi:hypothetical protein
MSPLLLALLLGAQSPSAPDRSVLANDHPQFPIGFAKESKLLEDVNQAAIRDPSGVADFMEQATKRGELLAISSGTKAKPFSKEKLRGPVFKEIVRVEVTDGPQKGLRGWVCNDALVTEAQFAGIEAAKDEKKAEEPTFKPLFRDPISGEKAYLAPQPTMFDMVPSLIRLAVADESAPQVFSEWQGATGGSRDAVIKALERKKAIFVTPVNTQVKVQKVFSDKPVNGIYPVQVELESGFFKGRVGWVPVTVVSPVPGVSVKASAVHEDQRRAALQKTIDLRHQKKQQRSNYQASVSADQAAKAAKDSEQERRDAQVRSQLQLQMLQQQAAVAEARAANAQAGAFQQMTQTMRQQQLLNAQLNGEGIYYGPNGPMTMDEVLRSRNQ